MKKRSGHWEKPPASTPKPNVMPAPQKKRDNKFIYNLEYCKYPTAELANEVGFFPPASSYNHYWDGVGKVIHPDSWYGPVDYLHIIYAPTQEQTQKWIREKYGIHVEIYSNASGWGWILTKINGTTIKEIRDDIFFDSYEEALEVGLNKALEFIKERR